MKIVVTSTGRDLDAPVSMIFGRSPVFIFVETDEGPASTTFEAVDNPAVGASGGAGVQAAQFVLAQGAEAVLSGNLGPNAFRVIQAGGVPAYQVTGGTVRDALKALEAGELTQIATPGADHVGLGMGRRRRGL
jgi:predicted Fe-Mo cluster-binding NifX family protein